MHLLILLVLIISVHSQSDTCSCSCCTGVNCMPISVGTIVLPSCTNDFCTARCQITFPQCQITSSSVQVIGQCYATVNPLYNCRCDCCRTGSSSCAPTLVGFSSAYVCDVAACSISCSRTYPNQCVSDTTGQTQGTCAGLITTTTATTTSTTTTATNPISAGLIYSCSCQCCQSGPSCIPNIDVGITAASQCSPGACTQACQARYPGLCPTLANLGQTNGTCSNENNGNTICQCQCCQNNRCTSYQTRINGDCALCRTQCERVSPCANNIPVTYTCTKSQTLQLKSSFLWIITVLIVFLGGQKNFSIE